MADKKNGTNGSGTGAAGKKNGAPAAAPTQGPKSGKAKGEMTKWDAVKRVLNDLGWGVMPLAIKDHVKQKYGIEITAHVASNYKKKLKKMAREAAALQAATSAKKPAAPAAPVASSPKKAAAPASNAPASAKKPAAPKPQAKSPAAAPAPPAHAKGKNGAAGDSILLQDVLVAKELLDRVGAGPLRTLLDGLAK